MPSKVPTKERDRLHEDATRERNWSRFGPYLSERQWGTVREDYSANGDCWNYFPHDHARSRAYRWGEDGLLGITDRQCRLCFAFAFWNGKDPFLKERLFGVSGPEGNHGEDVKEEYFYLDALPTSSFLRALYKYPQAAFPYQQLVDENKKRGRDQREYELADTGVFAGNRYFDVVATYAKADADDLLIELTVHNRGPEPATLHVLPQLWFRNTWAWGRTGEGYWPRGVIVPDGDRRFVANGADLPAMALELDEIEHGRCRGVLATENETNTRRLFGSGDPLAFVKDAFHEHVVKGNTIACNPARSGSKVAWHCVLDVPAGGSARLRMRLRATSAREEKPFGKSFDAVLAARQKEADAFYDEVIGTHADAEARAIQRQAYAGLIWSKQFYHLDVKTWLSGDPAQPPPPKERRSGRNADFVHLYNRDVVSMPDKWEYPWYAAWDLAFHMIPFAKIDPDFAKNQLLLLLREWYMAPNGQIPAYEFAFNDVNPPVHAWACWRVYKMTGTRGHRDVAFLARAFHKLLLNFTWWVNRKDLQGKHVFGGGFLGLDNIGVFDRSAPLPTGGHIEQSDATSWMGMYCLNMLAIALELARDNRAYEDVASKFFEHFVYICHAMNNLGGGVELWDKHDGFFYDVLSLPDGRKKPLKVRSLVGLIPLYAVETLDSEVIDRLPGFKRRMQWFIENRPELSDHVEALTTPDLRVLRLLALVGRERLRQVLRYMLDENEFLSPYGIRALSRHHLEHPYLLDVEGTTHRVDYEPGESRSHLFGGNSNWRGPVWFPVNFLLIESLQRYHFFFGDDFKVEFPTGSGVRMNLWQVASELSRRLLRIFLPDQDGVRPCLREMKLFRDDPHFADLLLFHEYFHGETGAGVGANHQTGWTALIAKLIQQSGE